MRFRDNNQQSQVEDKTESRRLRCVGVQEKAKVLDDRPTHLAMNATLFRPPNS